MSRGKARSTTAAQAKAVPRTDASAVASAPSRSPAQRADDWANVLTGIGMVTKDKRLGAAFASERLSPSTGEDMRRGDDVAARVVEALPDEMTRQGFELVIADDAGSLAEEVIAYCDELDVLGTLHEALCVARATGGAGILLGAEDGAAASHPELPLDPSRVKRMDWLTVFNCEELRPVSYFERATERSYGKPETYEIRETGFGGSARKLVVASDKPKVHASRILRFDGVPVPRRYARETQGWGDSVLLRCAHVIRDYQTSWSGAAILLQEFAQTVFKLKDLAGMVAGDEDELVVKRAQLVAISRSIANAVIIDEEESFERVTTPLSGLPEMLGQFALRLSSAARTPAMILMGQSPSGLNATGAGDLRWWYDTVQVQRNRILRPALNYIIQIAFAALGAKEPDNWTVKFPSLWQPTELEQATLRKTQAEVDQIYITQQVILPEEVAISRFGGDDYDTKTTIDTALRKRIGGETDELPEPIVEPGAPDVEESENPEAVDPTTALNGAQVSSMLEIVTAVAEGKLPRESGIAMLNAAFPFSVEQAEKVMGTVGTTFEITPSPAAPPSSEGQAGASSDATEPEAGGDDSQDEGGE